MLTPDYELSILKEGKYSRIIGIDEVGRGCWAGPVAVGAYVFSPDSEICEGISDSKLLNLKQRSETYQRLCQHTYAVMYGELDEINTVGIGKTLHLVISRLIEQYNSPETLFLIDGRFSQKFGDNTLQVVDGDALYYTIAAASILAKVERDSLMAKLDNEYIGYGFAKHKGYGTKLHQAALAKLGPSALHRRTYKPIQKYYEVQQPAPNS
jgi:ribonuclease HII